jgi:Dolichyl-phosphate-mannose-protein mannosyltransferase
MTDAQLTDPAMAVAARGRTAQRRIAGFLRANIWLVTVLGAATALRVIALVAVYPGIWFSDTNEFLKTAISGQLSVVRVQGYALFIAPFVHGGSAAALIVLQHLLGLAIVIVLYLLLLRRGVRKPIALIAVIPAALDPYLIALEHMIMSETLFHACVVGAVALLLWRERLRIQEALAGGLLFGYAGVTRSVAIPFVAVFLLYLVVRRVGLYPLLAFALGWALIVCGYMTIFKIQHGEFAFTQWEGRFLYAKVAPFTKCSNLGDIPADERRLCPENAARNYGPNGFLWGKGSPIHDVPPSDDDRIQDFSLRAIREQPLRYAKVVGRDTLHYFEPGHRIGRNDYSDTAWQFPSDPRHWEYPGYRGPIRDGSEDRVHDIDPSQYVNGMVDRPSVNVQASRFLHYYQRVFYTSGQVLAACVLLVLAALVRRAPGRFRLRLDATVVAACAVTALIVASALSIFDFRYSLLGVVLLPTAGGLALSSLLGEKDPVPLET